MVGVASYKVDSSRLKEHPIGITKDAIAFGQPNFPFSHNSW